MTGDTETAQRLFTVDDFRLRALRLGAENVGDFGDHHLNPDFTALARAKVKNHAAVLIPVVDHSDTPSVLLTQRAQNMRTHSGQVAFPGGKIDPEDGTAEVAAVRECEEETGIGPDHIEIIGRLPDYMSGMGIRISPILSVVSPGFRLQPNPHEVDAVFDVPLAFLMDQANHRRGSKVFQGKERHFYEMPYGDRYIWGVTAGIIRMMYERLYA
jgi:8-oxo-dGTP pyrophosphatase MutT (NUDIX family)